MSNRLTLSKETLRALDEQQLTMVVGGSGSGSDSKPKKGGWGKTGKHRKCNAYKSKHSSCG